MYYNKQEKFEETEALIRQTLQSIQRVVGQDHISTVSSVLNLVHVLCALSKYDEAGIFCEQAIESSRRISNETFEIALN